MAELIEAFGISIDEATQRLEDEGAEKFIKPFVGLMRTPAKPSWPVCALRSKKELFLFMMPTAIITIWLSGLLSLGIIGGAVYSLREWSQTAWVYDSLLNKTVFDPDIGLNAPTALLAGGLLLLIWAVAGSLLVQLFLRLTSRQSRDDRPTRVRDGRA